jgi:hypothetical protein
MTQARKMGCSQKSLGPLRVPNPSRVRKIKPRDLIETKKEPMTEKKAKWQRMR